MTKHKKGDQRDATTLMIREVTRYLERYPELKPYTQQFTDAVFERMDSMTMNILTARDNRGITSMNTPEYRKLEEVIESAYPTWANIKDIIIAGKEVRFPRMSKRILDGKYPLVYD